MLKKNLHPTFYIEVMKTIEEVENKVNYAPVTYYQEEEIKSNALPEIPHQLKRINKWADLIGQSLPPGAFQPIDLKEYFHLVR